MDSDLSTSPSADGYAQDDNWYMNKIQYFDILKNAFLITWKNKFLWFFGFLILLGSIGSNFNFSSDNIASQGVKNQNLATFVQENPAISVISGIILFIVMLGLFLLRIMAIAAIIKAANNIKLYQQLSTLSILKETRSYLGRLIGLEIIVGAALLAVGFVLAIPVLYLFALKAKILAYCVLVLAISIFLPLVIVGYYLIKYASLYIVLIDSKLLVSLEAAYALFSSNSKESLFMGLINVGVNVLLIIVLLSLIIPLLVIFMPVGALVYALFAKAAVMAVFIIAALVYVIILSLVVSWYASFLRTAWLLFFQQIAFESQGF